MRRQVYNPTYAKQTAINKLPIAYQVDEVQHARWVYVQLGLFQDPGSATAPIFNQNIGVRFYQGIFGQSNAWLDPNQYTIRTEKPSGIMQGVNSQQELPVVNDRIQYLIEFYGIAPANGTIEFVLIPFDD